MSETEKAYNGQLVLCPYCDKPSTFTEHIKNGYFDKSVCDNCNYNFKRGNSMQIYERCYYEKKCPKCKEIVFALTQPDNRPEYHSAVGVQHTCGQIIWFELPVN